jgi:hypothetical protein
MSAPTGGRQVSLGPGIPRLDVDPLDLPLSEPPAPAICYVCGGRGTRTVDPKAEPWTCNVCQGSGEIGGGR